MGIRLGPTAAARELRVFVNEVTAALGRPQALVTDESRINDFLEWGDDPGKDERNQAVIDTASRALGVPVDKSERIVAVAKRRQAFIQGGRS